MKIDKIKRGGKKETGEVIPLSLDRVDKYLLQLLSLDTADIWKDEEEGEGKEGRNMGVNNSIQISTWGKRQSR